MFVRMAREVGRRAFEPGAIIPHCAVTNSMPASAARRNAPAPNGPTVGVRHDCAEVDLDVVTRGHVVEVAHECNGMGAKGARCHPKDAALHCLLDGMGLASWHDARRR